jgi:hypothetical protein
MKKASKPVHRRASFIDYLKPAFHCLAADADFRAKGRATADNHD